MKSKRYNLECAIGHGKNLDSEIWIIEDRNLTLSQAQYYFRMVMKHYDMVTNTGWKARIVEVEDT